MNQYRITFDLAKKTMWGKIEDQDYPRGTTILEAPDDRMAFAMANKLYESCSNWSIKPIEPTCELTKELAKREAVQDIRVEPHVPIEIKVDGKTIKTEIDGGPCHIFVVYD